jgi:hypothetical protein
MTPLLLVKIRGVECVVEEPLVAFKLELVVGIVNVDIVVLLEDKDGSGVGVGIGIGAVVV